MDERTRNILIGAIAVAVLAGVAYAFVLHRDAYPDDE